MVYKNRYLFALLLLLSLLGVQQSAQAAENSTADLVIDYSENFNDNNAQSWTLSSNLAASGGELKSTGWGSSVSGTYNTAFSGTYTYAVDVQPVGGGSGNVTRVLFNYSNNNNYYYVELQGGGSGVVSLKKRVNGGTSTIATYGAYQTNGRTTRISVTYNSGSISASATQSGSTTTLFNNVSDSSFSSGKIGVSTAYNVADFDNVTVSASGSSGGSNSGGSGSSNCGIVVRAKGSCGGERMRIKVNGSIVSTHTMTTAFANYTYNSFTGGNVQVTFDNDSNNGCDLNLFVDRITVDGTVFLTSSSATTPGLPSGCGSIPWGQLWCNGTFDFGTRSCSGGGTPANSLTVSPGTLSGSNTSGSQPASIASNVSWSVTDNAGWLSVSPTSGSNNGSLSISRTANTSTSNRTGTVTITGGGITRTISVTQSGQTSGGGGGGSNDVCENNVLTNPGWESGSSPWVYQSSAVRSTSSGHSYQGSAGLRLDNPGATAYQTVTAQANQSYTFSMYAKNLSTSSTKPRAIIQYLNSGNAVLSQKTVLFDGASFQEYTTTGTTPANTAKIRVRFTRPSSGTNNEAFVDNVCLSLGSSSGGGGDGGGGDPPSTFTCDNNNIANPSFESNMTSWSVQAGSASTTTNSSHVSSGSRALRLTSAGAKVQQVKNGITAGTSFNLSVAVKNTGSDWSGLWYGFFTNGWAQVGSGSLNFPSNANSFSTVSTSMTAPANATRILIVFTRGDDNTGTVYIDDVCLSTAGSSGGGGGSNDSYVWTKSGSKLTYNNAVSIGNGNDDFAVGHNLSIDGKAIAEAALIDYQANWPDYVFTEKYKLPSIEELKAFILTNGHLPGFAPAAEVEENGFELSATHTQLVEHVEVLTLLLLEERKEQKALEARLRVLQALKASKSEK